MRLVLDAGALIAIDRRERRIAALLVLARRSGAELVTVTPVVAQAWRDGSRQVSLARALPMMDLVDTDLATAKAAGELLRRSGGGDVVDALLALTVRPTDQVLTSDPDELAVLLDAREVSATVVRV